MIIDAEKSHNLSSTNWRLRKASNGVTAKGLGTGGAIGITPSPKAHRPAVLKSEGGRKWICSLKEK